MSKTDAGERAKMVGRCSVLQAGVSLPKLTLAQTSHKGKLMAISKNKMLSAAAWKQLAQGLGMSPRQKQIARCLFTGLGDKQIAQELGVSVPTVRTHLSRLFAKLDVGDRVELILHLMNQYCTNYCTLRQ